MEWAALIGDLFTIVLIPLLGILVKYFIRFINIKSTELKQKKDDALYHKYIDLLNKTIVHVVTATNQTYVDSLKEQGKFDKEAQLEALHRSYETVMSILSTEAQTYLSSVLGDLNTYVTAMIESQVKYNKQIYN